MLLYLTSIRYKTLFSPPRIAASRSHTSHFVGLLWRPPRDNTQNLQDTDIHVPGAIEPAISVGEWPQTYAFDRTATGIGPSSKGKGAP